MKIKKLFEEFGHINNEKVALTIDGNIAIRRNQDEYVRYNAEKEIIENHMGLIFPGASKMIYVLPVTTVIEGDVIRTKGTYYQVLKVNENGSLAAINLKAGTKNTICKETNVIGFNFYYKVISLFTEGTNTTAAGINPMMLMLLSDKGETDDILPFLLMGNADFAKNPMMLMALMGDSNTDMKDMLMFSALSGGAIFGNDAAATPGSINPLTFLLMNEGKSDIKDMLLLSTLAGGKSLF